MAGHEGCGHTRMTLFSFIYQKKVRDLFWQALVLGLTLGLLVFFILNASRNMREAGIASGFDFLWRTAGIEIPFVLTWYFGVIAALPGPRNSIPFFSVAFLNNRGLTIPLPNDAAPFGRAALVILVVLIVQIAFAWWAARRR